MSLSLDDAITSQLSDVPEELKKRIFAMMMGVISAEPPPPLPLSPSAPPSQEAAEPEKRKRKKSVKNFRGPQAAITKFVAKYPSDIGVAEQEIVEEVCTLGVVRIPDAPSAVSRALSKGSQTYYRLANGNWTLKRLMGKK